MHSPREERPLVTKNTWKQGVMTKQLEIRKVTDQNK